MHSDSPGFAQAHPVVGNQARKDRFDVLVADRFKASVRQLMGALKELVADFFVHAGIVSGGAFKRYWHFPIPFPVVHGAIVSARQE